jgi:hypothetical protein
MESTWIYNEDSMTWSHLERLKFLKALGSMAATLVESFKSFRQYGSYPGWEFYWVEIKQ